MKTKILCIFELVIIVLLVLMIILLLPEPIPDNKRVWFAEKSPDGKYEIVADFPYNNNESGFHTQITIYNEKRETDVLNMCVLNNGEIPDKDNYKLEWHEDHAKLIVINDLGGESVYRIYWEDLFFRS